MLLPFRNFDICFFLMQKNLAQEIQNKTSKLLEIKKRYNDLVKAVDEEFSEQINQYNEKKIHVPLELAKSILQALKKGNTKSEEFKNYVQQSSSAEIGGILNGKAV